MARKLGSSFIVVKDSRRAGTCEQISISKVLTVGNTHAIEHETYNSSVSSNS